WLNPKNELRRIRVKTSLVFIYIQYLNYSKSTSEINVSTEVKIPKTHRAIKLFKLSINMQN
ncbi:MAG: hypothetical protein ACI837_002006, partial [Crocinitomicaceae bacterium]